jgi:hypothetical protein
MTQSLTSLAQVLDQISQLPVDWHLAGTVDPSVLQAIAKYTNETKISHSVETGSGKTTVLFSHISLDHKVFAVDAGNKSIDAVRSHPLFNSKVVEFIEGPTQKTLPQYQFDHKIQVALIDGPHGYPFPDLEYYYLYPHIAEGGLLIVDDIHIATIRNLFNFLKEDAMFELLEVVQQTAFFRRTAEELFSPIEDGWWLQNYNKVRFPVKPEEVCASEVQVHLHQVETELNTVRSELERSQNRITAMESSKFWKLRTAWFQLKGLVGLGETNELN